MLIGLNELLEGKPFWTEVVAFFREGEFQEEHYLTRAIRKYLLSAEQRKRLDSEGLTIEDYLNGRCSREQVFKLRLAEEWNTQLGFRYFAC